MKKFIPTAILNRLRTPYHFLLAWLAAVWYRFPSRKLVVIGVTGTKGKTTTTELINLFFENAGHRTALVGTLRFKIGHRSVRNLKKMTMPGRFFLQKFLFDAVQEKCDVVILEMTSEGAKQFRHRFIDLDCFVFLNIAPEHIESHGSFENYLAAKRSLADSLSYSKKGRRILIVNRDIEESKAFLDVDTTEKYSFSTNEAEPTYADLEGIRMTIEDETMTTPLIGAFNISNILAATAVARVYDISLETIKASLAEFKGIRGRAERIREGQAFDIIVDYAHTPDSLAALYESFKTRHLVCILGNAGGGRDTWKRPEMGKIADRYCEYIYLTDEDPYDEDPRAIVEEMKAHIERTPAEIIMDRRVAINAALSRAYEIGSSATVLVSGKGTDPYIMRANGDKEPWDDATVVREELEKLLRGAQEEKVSKVVVQTAEDKEASTKKRKKQTQSGTKQRRGQRKR